MAYYNRDYKKLKMSGMNYLDNGCCATVLYNDEMILKEYFCTTLAKFRLTEKMFDIFKGIDNPHLIELFDIYSDFSPIELFKNRIGISSFTVDAYTAKYYPDNSLNVLFENKDYILDNFRELEILFEIFSENKICTNDVKRENAIVGKEKIVIIDPDLFYISDYAKKEILTINKKNLLKLYESILIASVEYEDNCMNITKFIYDELANIDITSDVDVTYGISQKLKSIKKPIEFFRK